MKQPTNFADLPPQYSRLENSAVVIIPVPYDGTSTWGKGADKGPQAIIEASANMELYDIETDSQVHLKGIFTDEFIESLPLPEDVIEKVSERVNSHIEKNLFTVVIGGEHSVSIGSIKAHAQKYKDMTVLQLDAHSDLRDEYNNSKYNHACVMARARQLCPIVQVGIRSMDSSEKQSMQKENVFFAKDIYNNRQWIPKAVSKLSDKVYITIDLDVFDTSIMPTTGTPEPGGLFWYDVLALLKAVFEKTNVVGFDVVELCPDSRNKAPAFLAAKLIYKALSYKFEA
ncbi:MAG: agmatinase [Planctomycetota bacterium]|jgi:agmatinase